MSFCASLHDSHFKDKVRFRSKIVGKIKGGYMKLLSKIRSSIYSPAVSETDLSCEIRYVVPAFICVMRKHKDRMLQLFPPKV